MSIELDNLDGFIFLWLKYCNDIVTVENNNGYLNRITIDPTNELIFNINKYTLYIVKSI